MLGLSIPAERKMVRAGELRGDTVKSTRGTPAYRITLPIGSTTSISQQSGHGESIVSGACDRCPVPRDG